MTKKSEGLLLLKRAQAVYEAPDMESTKPSPLMSLFWALLLVLPTGTASAQDHVGSEACAGCHQEVYAAWQVSHHRQAMAVATEASVLGDFDNAIFDYLGQTKG
jgi:hypothetical protein